MDWSGVLTRSGLEAVVPSCRKDGTKDSANSAAAFMMFLFSVSSHFMSFGRCLVKWLEVRCVCPMCNKPIAGAPEQHHSIGTLLDELV